MKLKAEITDKEKYVLRRLLALALIVANGIMMWYSASELDRIIPNYNFLGVTIGVSMIWVWILTTFAIFKHYR